MAKGIQNMSAEIVKGKKGEEPFEPVIKQKSSTKKPKLHNRVGYGSFKATVIMTNLSGGFVKVHRNRVTQHLTLGWKTVKREEYKAAVSKGASPATTAVVAGKKKK